METRTFNGRFQPTQIQAGSLLTLGYSYSANNNNGNLLTQTISRPSVSFSATQTYNGYDGVNRLTGTSESGSGAWSESEGYDNFGNRWVSATTGLPTPGLETPIFQSWFNGNNQINTWSYDIAGNVTSIAGMQRTFAYDGEGRQMTATINGTPTTYTYDGDGRRVTKTVSAGTTTTYVYDAIGQLAAEYGGTASFSGTTYLTQDHLGSTRLITSSAGAMLNCYDYFPFGGDISQAVNGRPSCYPANPNPADGATLKFTSKERDSETGLDFFGARYFSSAQGRFTSVDPIWVTGERLLDPQRLNLYAYGRNNPLRFIDPDGMDITLGKCDAGTTQQCYNQVLAGLQKDDRSHVQLVQGDGKNGFKKGEYGITVDQDYKSDSKNFQTLQKLAGDHSATARIDVLSPNDKFDVRTETTFNRNGAPSPLSTMSMTPGNPNDPNSSSFVGYTFFPPGTGAPGPYSIGNFTDVIANTISPDGISSTIHHELRHVLLGDFGRVAPYGAHGTGKVDRETTEAEKEAVKNSKVK